MEAEQGRFISFERLLSENPSTVASPGFIDRVVADILQVTDYLNSRGIYHVCFAPENVFVRIGDGRVMLLSHGSFYLNGVNPSLLYKGFEAYVAPEVMNGGSVDERCDVYSVGKFFEYIFTVAEMPYEYKAVIKRATCEVPEDRYLSVSHMASALKRRHSVKTSLYTFVAALVIAVLLVGFYFGLMPDDRPVEFVKPAAVQQPEEMLEKGFDPNTELGIRAPEDTATMMSPEQKKHMEEYEAKCEQIFRKMYTKEADRILSKIYNSTYMGSNEKKFMAGSKSTMDELVKAQAELAGRTHLSETRSQRIASEIIDELTERKKSELMKYGIQKETSD